MDKHIIIDPKSGYNIKQKAKSLIEFVKKHNINLKNTYIIFSNNANFVKKIREAFNQARVVNITTNFSQRYVKNVLDTVDDICYANSSIEILGKRIFKEII